MALAAPAAECAAVAADDADDAVVGGVVNNGAAVDDDADAVVAAAAADGEEEEAGAWNINVDDTESMSFRGVYGTAVVVSGASGDEISERSSISPGRHAEMMMRAQYWITVIFRRCIKRCVTAGS